MISCLCPLVLFNKVIPGKMYLNYLYGDILVEISQKRHTIHTES
jgi:hypothetical protein